MTNHKHSHDAGRAPLRLRPLPRPGRPAPAEPKIETTGAAEPADAGPDTSRDDDASPDAEHNEADVSGEWIHEWERPQA